MVSDEHEWRTTSYATKPAGRAQSAREEARRLPRGIPPKGMMSISRILLSSLAALPLRAGRRVGDYRVLHAINDAEVWAPVVRVAHRGEACRGL